MMIDDVNNDDDYDDGDNDDDDLFIHSFIHSFYLFMDLTSAKDMLIL